MHKSPCSQDVERGISVPKKNKVVAEKEGYKTCEFNTSGTVHPWFFGNIILGDLIGIAIDMGTGVVSSISEEDIGMVLYEDKPCDIYIRPRYREGDNKWVKCGETKATSPQEQKTQPKKEDYFKNVQTGMPQSPK